MKVGWINRFVSQKFPNRSEELLAMLERIVRHHVEAGTIFLRARLRSVMAAACKALEVAMELEGMALGVSEMLVRQG